MMSECKLVCYILKCLFEAIRLINSLHKGKNRFELLWNDKTPTSPIMGISPQQKMYRVTRKKPQHVFNDISKVKKRPHEHSQSKNTFIYITWITSADKNYDMSREPQCWSGTSRPFPGFLLGCNTFQKEFLFFLCSWWTHSCSRKPSGMLFIHFPVSYFSSEMLNL